MRYVEEGFMKSILVETSKEFAISIMRVCKTIQEERRETTVVKQLLRSGTSIGANIHEANYASSRMDFINKLQIALKECYETEYWLDIFKEVGYLYQKEYDSLSSACSKIRVLLTSSIKTAKNNI